MRDVLGKCPICSEATTVTRVDCSNCGTTIEGNFNLCNFCKLSLEQKQFVDIFIKCKGNIKEVEKELSISYPTVKNKLEDVAKALGHKFGEEQPFISNIDVLNNLSSGKISVEEAMELLNKR